MDRNPPCALDSARHVGDQHAQAWVLNNLGIAFAQQLRCEEAIGYLRHALAIRCEIGDRHGEAYSLNNLATRFNTCAGTPRALPVTSRPC